MSQERKRRFKRVKSILPERLAAMKKVWKLVIKKKLVALNGTETRKVIVQFSLLKEMTDSTPLNHCLTFTKKKVENFWLKKTRDVTPLPSFNNSINYVAKCY